MKKVLFFIFILFLSFSSVSLLKPQAAEAAEGGPAGKLMLQAVSGPLSGQVTLSWRDADSADNYHLVYGTDPKNMKYGVLNLGSGNVYTVGMLNPGTKYYFALVPVVAKRALYTSDWASAVAAGGEVTKPAVEATAAAVTPVAKITPVVPLVWTGSGPVDKLGLWAKAGPNEGEATLYWKNADDANNYHLVYGTEAGKYQYGALNIGWTTSYTVKKLVPGVTYYFALVPVKGNRALYTTNSVAVTAKVNAEIVTTTREAVMQPLSTIIPPPGLTGTQATSPSYPPYTSGQ